MFLSGWTAAEYAPPLVVVALVTTRAAFSPHACPSIATFSFAALLETEPVSVTELPKVTRAGVSATDTDAGAAWTTTVPLSFLSCASVYWKVPALENVQTALCVAWDERVLEKN